MKILIYGANGYTGKLIIKKAILQSLNIVISGRNKKEISKLADKNNLNYFTSTPKELQKNFQLLEKFDLLLNCAGPFSKTAKPIIKACLSSKTHYLDITGEIDIFRLGKSFDNKAKDSNIIICPGVGFDVIPTDCLAAALSKKLPDADELILGFESTAKKISPGTMATSIESLGYGGKIRKNGKITSVPLAYKTKKIDFGNGIKTMVTIPWGDVATAYYSTGIPNITVFTPRTQKGIDKIKRQRKWLFIMKLGIVQNFIKNKLDKKIVNGGDSDEKRAQSKMWVWAEVKNNSGQLYSGKFQVANGYDVTGFGAMAVAKYLLEKELAGGYYTPSKLMGPDILDSLPGFSGIEYSNN